MTAQLLSNELSALSQDSKRKNHDLRNAAETSLAELKALPQTSEAQLSADLRNRPNFVKPFLLACSTRNAKYAGSAIVCLQRLVLTKALPKESLTGVLEALRDCVSLALDIQLKVLQALPSLLQNYSGALSDKLLAATFEVCFLLYNSKTAVVSNTAAAALQQLVTSTFEKVALEDGSLEDVIPTSEASTADGVVQVHGAASDACKILNDVCLMTEGQRPTFLATGSLSQNFGFELLESALTNHADTIIGHSEQIHILRLRLMPLIVKIVSDKVPFATTVRVMRLLQLVISRLLFGLAPECESALRLLNRIVENDGIPPWKRALVLEVFRELHSNPTLMRSIYTHFDEDEKRKDIVRDHLASLVRLASEKPNVIGLGQQSSVSTRPKDDWADQVALQAGGIVGSIGAAIGAPDSDVSGISSRWSIPRTPCLELLDKIEPPSLPATYVYALAVTCISSFSDGLGKFLLPFASLKENKAKKKDRLPHENGSATPDHPEADAVLSRRRSLRTRKAPVNPLTLEDHVLYRQICTSAHMVDNCWPALLAVSSTFLNATLDSDYFHALIRSFQKFTQVAGLLGLPTPRDAFLTTLAKISVPIGSSITLAIMPSLDHSSQPESNENSDLESSPAPSKRSSFDPGEIEMTPRNLLCLRALLNLGIALGSLLQKSWSIILETLQRAEMMLPRSNKGQRKIPRQPSQVASSQIVSEESKNGEDFGLEVLAAETAATRMIESTGDLPDDAFLDFITSLNDLFRNSQMDDGYPEESRVGLLSPETPVRKHTRFPSISTTNDAAGLQGNMFVLEKVEQLVQCNVSRFTNIQSNNCLDLVIKQLKSTLGSQTVNPKLRIKSAEILNELIISIATSNETLPDEQDELLRKLFSAISGSIAALYEKVRQQSRDSQNCRAEVHRILLEGLRSILEQCGDSLQTGWDTSFAIITSAFDQSSTTDEAQALSKFRSKSPILVRSSYGSLQLICSDYLNFVPLACLSMLLDTLYMFSSQPEDLNISLTTTTFFANVSGFLQRHGESLDFDEALMSCTSDSELITIVTDGSSKFPLSALWLLLLSRLKDITTDERLEVRHSALRTLFRILNDCGDDLSASTWRVCFRTVIRQMLIANQRKYEQCGTDNDAKLAETGTTLQAEWNKSAVILVEGMASVMSTNLNIMKGDHTFSETWRELLQCLRWLADRNVLDLSKAIFSGLVSILEEIEDIRSVSKNSINETWTLWKQSNPVSHASLSDTTSNNQDALLAYLRCLAQIYRLKDADARMDGADAVLEELRSCIVNANVDAYSTDVARVTPVQQGVLENLKMIPTTSSTALSHVVLFVTFLVILPYRDARTKEKGQTHLAISNLAIGVLQELVNTHVKVVDSPYQLVTQALNALATPIHLKYNWYVGSLTPSTWRTATTAGLKILETCLPNLLDEQEPEEVTEAFWEQVVRIVDGIVTADVKSCKTGTDILEDQDFDVQAFSRIQQLVIPTLGSPSISDPRRTDFAKSIFEKSLIHEPHPDDLARPGQELLDGLKNPHIGRTDHLPPSPRVKMSYVLLDELFSLVAVHDGSPERVRLSQAAAPYLILRAGLTLRAYALDHPLRGLAPQPYSQKLEMLHMLKNLVELKCEPKAMPNVTSVVSLHKKPLYHLYPLVTKAMKVAHRDAEMTRALGEVLVTVGQDFGT